MKRRQALRAFLLAAALARCRCARVADEVEQLPGWEGELPSRHYSGYLPVGPEKRRHLHYYFILSESDPSSDPVTLWLNGGPGSSSIAVGMMTEVGQLVLNRESLERNVSGAPALQYNPYSWARQSSLLFLESPAGVGFSYCDYAPCASNDTSTALDAYDALVAFFSLFGEFSKLPFFITGESYAGIYCPMLAEQIMLRGGVNLVGLAVGNGCWGNRVGTCAFGWDQKRLEMEFQFGHSMFPSTLYRQIKAECMFPEPVPAHWQPSARCEELMQASQDASQGGVNENVYDFCATGGSQQQRLLREGGGASLPEPNPHAGRSDGPLGSRQMWCGGRNAYPHLYAALPAVQAAWHVRGHPSSGDMRYTRAPAGDLRPLYAALARRYRLLIYSGDADGCVPHTGTEEWTHDLGFEVRSPWRPWTLGGGAAAASHAEGVSVSISGKAVAGYATEFGGDAVGFTFATVMGAGHEVPTFRPEAAQDMITRFQRGLPLATTYTGVKDTVLVA